MYPTKSQQSMVAVKMLFMLSIITEKEYHNSFKDKLRGSMYFSDDIKKQSLRSWFGDTRN